MRVNLRVPYAEKDEAKRLGARWDPGTKTWYVVNHDNLESLRRWLPLKEEKRRKERVDKLARKVRLIENTARKRVQKRLSTAVTTPCTNFSLPALSCSCSPFVVCEHHPAYVSAPTI